MPLMGDSINVSSEVVGKASTGVQSNKEAKEKATKALSSANYDLALFYYIKALEFDDKDTDSLHQIAKIHDLRGDIASSTLAYRMILEDDPEDLVAMEGLGRRYLQQNKTNEAELLFEKVISKNPNSANSLMGLGVISDLKSDFAAAEQYYQKAIAISPKSVEILNNYAYSKYLSGDWDEAEKLYKKTLAAYPNHPQTLLNYGLLKARQDKPNEAIMLFKKVLSEPQAYNELGYIYMVQHDYEKAKQLFIKAISASPTYFEEASRNLEQLNILVNEITSKGVQER
jgi:Flp pilus assembly protein TadD